MFKTTGFPAKGFEQFVPNVRTVTKYVPDAKLGKLGDVCHVAPLFILYSIPPTPKGRVVAATDMLPFAKAQVEGVTVVTV